MKKTIALLLALVLTIGLFAACGKTPAEKTDTAPTGDGMQIAIPNDTTNEARALILLENLGIIKLKEGAGVTATILDIVDNPFNVDFKEVEAAQLPGVLQDVDYAVINSNYALAAGLVPATDALSLEGAYSAYGNIVAVKEGNEETAKTRALVAALESKKVADFITEKYSGSVLSVVENPGDGFDPDVNYDELAGETIKVGASPAPHAEILAVAKEILAEKNITLEVVEFTDYVQPNNAVESGEIDANYFQHNPYLVDFNANNGTHINAVSYIHVEPLGIYGGKQTSLDPVTAK
ncbi:MAG: hypothetical protein IJK89_06915 [Clostridia bacterium]|nr:hypothetical protein [Clostridia bacterium]